MKQELFGLFLAEIADAIIPYNIEKYRAKQIADWLYRHGADYFADMKNIPAKLRSLLDSQFSISQVKVLSVQHAADSSTDKYLLQFQDGSAVETVLMRHSYGNSVCVSTQVGCAMGCRFCASTLLGKSRDLSAGEILRQVLFIQQILNKEQSKLHSLVIMGTGEPLENYANVLRFMRLCHEPYCLNLSYRHMTLSTAGLIPQIDMLADEGLPITLSISLHAPNNVIRSRLMPINNKYPIELLLAAADRYAQKTGRRITYEYILLKEINSLPEHARELAVLLQGKLANVNLIPANPVPERGLLRPAASSIREFLTILQQKGISVTIRKEMGADIQAACGQLRYRSFKELPQEK